MVFRRSSSAGAGLHLLLKTAHLRKSDRGGGSGPASALENSTFEKWGERRVGEKSDRQRRKRAPPVGSRSTPL